MRDVFQVEEITRHEFWSTIWMHVLDSYIQMVIRVIKSTVDLNRFNSSYHLTQIFRKSESHSIGKATLVTSGVNL